MAQFVALPVNCGDAFFLHRGDYSCLVDGGKAEAGFANLFTIRTGRIGVDVLICTHNEADHVNGLLGFLRAGLACRELWLPGSWQPVLDGVLSAGVTLPLRIADEIGDALSTTNIGHDGSRNLEQVGEIFAAAADSASAGGSGDRPNLRGDHDVPGVSDGPEIDAAPYDGMPAWLTNALESFDDRGYELEFGTMVYSGAPFLPPPFRRRIAPGQAGLLVEAVAAGRSIAALAREAFHRGIRIRWFEYDPSSPGGGRPWLRPLNSKEIFQIRRLPPEASLFRMIALSQVNKESLAFWSPPDAHGPGVLFCGDTDLGAGTHDQVTLPTSEMQSAIVTAPHHGSEANDRAYDLVENGIAPAAPHLTWVRSDSRSSKRPSARYVKVVGRKFCTLCNHTGSGKQGVVLNSTPNAWVAQPGTVSCTCR